MIRFKSRLAHMGENNRIIWIPKALALEIEELEDKELVVTLTDAKANVTIDGKMPDIYWKRKKREEEEKKRRRGKIIKNESPYRF
jgi:dTDP-4-dehydrorhamnose 3,5-epimerase-like enzyme